MRNKLLIAAVGALSLSLFGCSMGTTKNNDNKNSLNNNSSSQMSLNSENGTKKVPVGDTVISGNIVSVDYVGKLEDGTVFDTSLEKVAIESGNYMTGRNYSPLKFTVGGGQMIKGFDKGVVGMKIGETKSITIAPEEGYGMPDPKNIYEIPASNFSGIDVKEGNEYNFGGYNGKVIKIEKDIVKVDFNHKLAGKTLVFEVTLKSIE